MVTCRHVSVRAPEFKWTMEDTKEKSVRVEMDIVKTIGDEQKRGTTAIQESAE